MQLARRSRVAAAKRHRARVGRRTPAGEAAPAPRRRSSRWCAVDTPPRPRMTTSHRRQLRAASPTPPRDSASCRRRGRWAAPHGPVIPGPPAGHDWPAGGPPGHDGAGVIFGQHDTSAGPQPRPCLATSSLLAQRPISSSMYLFAISGGAATRKGLRGWLTSTLITYEDLKISKKNRAIRQPLSPWSADSRGISLHRRGAPRDGVPIDLPPIQAGTPQEF